MRRMLKRWHVWLAVLLLTGVSASGMLTYSSRSQVNQLNFDLIQEGMTEEEVLAILGVADIQAAGPELGGHNRRMICWRNGPNRIVVLFDDARVEDKGADLANAFETLTWYANRGLKKIGVRRWVEARITTPIPAHASCKFGRFLVLHECAPTLCVRRKMV